MEFIKINNSATLSNNNRRSGPCLVDNKDTLSFQIMFGIGAVFTAILGFTSFYMDKIGQRILVRKFFYHGSLNKEIYFYVRHVSAAWLIVSTVCCIGLAFLTEFYSIVVSFIAFLSCGLCAANVSAISVALYPTNFKAMVRFE